VSAGVEAMSVRIQIVDAKEADYNQIIQSLKENGHQVSFVASWKKALKSFKREKPDMVFLSTGLPELNGIGTFTRIKRNGDGTDFFAVVDSREQGLEAMKLGAAHYFVRPCNPEEVKIVTARVLAERCYRKRVERLRRSYLQQLESDDRLAVSKTMKELYQQVIKIAEAGVHPVLLAGETGTGKELLAQIIHLHSSHFMSPFIPLCCKAVTSARLEEHLLAMSRENGSCGEEIENGLALEGGTLFLSHIERLSKADQARVLKFLKGRRAAAERKASKKPWGRCVVAATGENLKQLVDGGKFNKELYQLLSKRTVHIPPLRKRPGEIIALAQHFIEVFNTTYDRQVKKIDPAVKQHLESCEWPGNVSELKNVIEHCVIAARFEHLTMEDLEFKGNKQVASLDTLLLNGSFLSLDEMVALYVKTVLKKVKGNKSRAAKLLKVSRNTLKKKSVVI
jgi:DNA-binding NtrC family response regulator